MRIIISCGGTGGHIYPGIAIADKIKERHPDAEILFIGTKKGMENQLVPNAGYQIKGIDAKGFDRKHLLNNFKTVHDVLLGSNEMNEILDEFKPDLAIGTGGYVTGPVLLQVNHRKIPTYVHEQNAMPGVANKIISSFAKNVFVSFDGTQHYFSHPNRVVLTGNPVRADFSKTDRAAAREKLGLSPSKKLLLIFGGSLGAGVINEQSIKLIDELRSQNKDINIIFVTGNRFYDDVKAELDAKGGVPDYVQLLSYAYNMPELMSAADLIVSRSGAIAVSEVAASGRASILIPSPNVTANHQFYNAKALADKGAAVLIEEKDILSGSKNFAAEVKSLLDDEVKLKEMSANALAMAKLDAADIICDNLGL